MHFHNLFIQKVNRNFVVPYNFRVAGLIPDGVIGIFHWYKPSGRTMALGSNQPLTEMSTRNIFWGVRPAGA